MLKLLNENYKKTHDKRAKQEKEWHRFFDWKRDGNKFIITEVFDEPKIETIQNGKSKYINYFGFILLEILRENENEICIFKNQLMEKMRIKSHRLVEYLRDNKEDEYAAIVNDTINQIFNSQIKQLQSKNLIKIEPVYEFISVSERTGKTVLTELTEEELKIYKHLEEDVLIDFAIDYNLDPDDVKPIKKRISIYNAWNKYYQELDKLIKKKFAHDIVQRLKITLVTDALFDVNRDTVYDDLNAAINKRLIEVAEKYKDDEEKHDAILNLADFNNTLPEEPTFESIEITDEDTIRELNSMYEKYGNNMWDDSDEDIPKPTFEFYETKSHQKRTRKCLDDYA